MILRICALAIACLILVAGTMVAQNPTANQSPTSLSAKSIAPTTGAATPDPKDAQIAALKAENAKLAQQVSLYKQQVQALNIFYSTDNALKSMDSPAPQPDKETK